MCNKPECKEIPIKDCCKYNGPSYPQLGIEQGMSYEDVFSAISSYVETIQTTDGETGPQGLPGEDGIGIESVASNGEGTLTFTFSNGSTYTTPNLTGPQGATGPQGLSTLFKFSSSGSTTPSSGFFTADTGTVNSGTSTFYFNSINTDGLNVFPFLNRFENIENTRPRYGSLIITDPNNISRRFDCSIVSTNSSTAYEVVIDNFNAYLNPPVNTFVNGNEYVVTFIPSESVTKTIVLPYNWQVISSGYLYSLPIASLSGYGLTDYAKIIDLQATVTSGIAGQPIYPINIAFPAPGDPAGSIFATDTSIILQAVAGRWFDNASFDNTLQRGHITITFLK